MKMRVINFQKVVFSLLLLVTTAILGCGSNSETAKTPPTKNSQPSTTVSPPSSPVANKTDSIKFKQEGGGEAFELKSRSDGAKLVDKTDKELAKFNLDEKQKIKIKDSQDQVLGYVVTKNGYWKLENAEQNKELFILRYQSDGDYKLEDGSNQEIYRIKVRDYGLEIESPSKKSLYKVKIKDGKTSLRNASDRTVIYTKSQITPIAIACFGFDVLSKEQKAALAYAVNRSGGK
jgi:hypothetical protein